jgi:hypothetical protein
VCGRDDNGCVRVIALKLCGEPQTVAPGHHDIDDRQVVVTSAERGERLISAGRRLGFQAQGRNPPRHDVAHRGLVIDDKDGGHRCHRCGISFGLVRSQDYCHSLNRPICL